MCSHGRSYFTPYKPVDVQHKNLIDRVMSGQDPAEAYVEAGLPATTDPEHVANKIMKRGNNQAYISRVLDDHGATNEKIAETLSAGMDATKVRYRKGLVEVENEETGEVEFKAGIEKHEDPDHGERRQAAMAVATLKGFTGKAEGDGGSTVVRVYSPFSPRPDRDGDVPDGLAIEVRHEH